MRGDKSNLSKSRERTRIRNKINQQRRRRNLTEEQLEKKREYDRSRYKKKRIEQTVSDDDEPLTPEVQDFVCDRLRLISIQKKLHDEMKFFNIVNEDLLFEKKLDALHIKECKSCDTFFWSNHSVCYCGKYKSMVEVLKNIGEIPNELQGLSYVEEPLISKVHPMVSIYRLKGGQYAFRGNVINFRQDVAAFAKQLPHSISVLNGLISVCCNTPCFHEDFLIRRNKVSIALHWLKNNNKYYKDIVIDLTSIMALPDNGYFSHNLNIGNTQDLLDEKEDDPDTAAKIHRVVVPGITNVSNTDKVKHHLKWPRISSEPVNEFNSPGYIAQAFPVLYPYGVGDLYDVKSKKVTARVYFQYLMQKCDRRFSKHKLFPYFALNSTLRWEALSLGTLYVKKKPEVKNINIEDLKDMVNESMSLPKSVMIYSSSIRTSKAYWMTRTYELDSLVDRFGLPTIFFSISAADHHWPRQFEIILSQSSSDINVSDSSEKDRLNLLVENADLCADYFYETASIFVIEVLVPFLKVLEYWFRFEWQMRGVAHVHGVLWLSSAPNVIDFEKMSSTERKSVIDYFSNLVSACNPNLQYVVTANHPCRLKISQVDDVEEDIASLVNTVQKHKCSVHCLRKVPGSHKKTSGNSLQCRHNFPHKLQNESTIEKNARGHLEFFPRRNDPFINKFFRREIRIIRSNHDPTPILSYNGFVRYISKYASKGK